MLDVLKDVGKTIHSQVLGQPNPSGAHGSQLYQLLPSVATERDPSAGSMASGIQAALDSVAVKKPDDIIASPMGSKEQPALVQKPLNQSSQSFREQGEILRQEIVQRAAQLQTMITSSMGALKTNGDLIVRRLLLQMNHRLDLARAKADKIINEVSSSIPTDSLSL